MELRTERLILRPFRETDRDALSYLRDPDFLRFLTHDLPDPDQFLKSGLEADATTEAAWVIEEADELAGTVHVFRHEGTATYELAYLIAPTHWGRGIAAEACRAALGHAFETWSVDRVVATADARNERSIRVLEKLGFVREGLVPGHRVDQEGRPANEVRYAFHRSR